MPTKWKIEIKGPIEMRSVQERQFKFKDDRKIYNEVLFMNNFREI